MISGRKEEDPCEDPFLFLCIDLFGQYVIFKVVKHRPLYYRQIIKIHTCVCPAAHVPGVKLVGVGGSLTSYQVLQDFTWDATSCG